MKRILVTGASGFVGRALVTHLSEQREFLLRASSRVEQRTPVPGCEFMVVPPLGPDASWEPALSGVNTVVHTAARVHVRDEQGTEALSEYRKTNVAGTFGLARQAVAAGVRRFVFLSSIKVNGERTRVGRPFHSDDPANPDGAYAISKHEAEEGLWEIQRTTGMEVVIIRPTLVYGPGVKANFETMMRWVYRGIPLPFAGIDNRRSLIAIENLVDFIRICCISPAAANRTWLVSDGEDLSTSELLCQLGAAFGRPARLFRLPTGLLTTTAGIVGRRDQIRRLLESLQVDTSASRESLNWTAPHSVENALRNAAESFRRGRYT